MLCLNTTAWGAWPDVELSAGLLSPKGAAVKPHFGLDAPFSANLPLKGKPFRLEVGGWLSPNQGTSRISDLSGMIVQIASGSTDAGGFEFQMPLSINIATLYSILDYKFGLDRPRGQVSCGPHLFGGVAGSLSKNAYARYDRSALDQTGIPVSISNDGNKMRLHLMYGAGMDLWGKGRLGARWSYLFISDLRNALDYTRDDGMSPEEKIIYTVPMAKFDLLVRL
jgi:hypothetical protein